MNKEDIIFKIQNIIMEVTENDNLLIDANTILNGSIGENRLNISSIDFVEIIVKVEEQFNIVIDFDVPINTVQDLVDIIVSNSQNMEYILGG